MGSQELIVSLGCALARRWTRGAAAQCGRLQGHDRQGEAIATPKSFCGRCSKPFRPTSRPTRSPCYIQLGSRIDLDRIWAKQAGSPELMEQIATLGQGGQRHAARHLWRTHGVGVGQAAGMQGRGDGRELLGNAADGIPEVKAA